MSQLFNSLTPEDLAQCGDLFKVSQAQATDAQLLNAPLTRVFAQWLSIVFMTAAQLGVARPQVSWRQRVCLMHVSQQVSIPVSEALPAQV